MADERQEAAERNRMRHECYFCHIRTIEKLIDKFQPEQQAADRFIHSVHTLMEANWERSNPELAAEIHRLARTHLGHAELYAEEKARANQILLERYSYWEGMVNKSHDPFFSAAKLAVIGNIIDYGAHSAGEDIAAQIEALFLHDLKVDMRAELQEAVSHADKILYLGDNCGEIVLDKLFIETMKHRDVTFAVRGAPVINDATLEDAAQVGLDEVCRVISNGSDAPSTLLEFSTDEFLKEYENADLILSKGQGNYEGLMDSPHSNLFFLLMAKCGPISRMLGVEINDMVIVKSSP